MRKFLVFSALLGVCLFANATKYTPQTIVNPKTLGADSYVSNADGVLSSVAVENINQLCKQLEEETKVQLAVVAIDELS